MNLATQLISAASGAAGVSPSVYLRVRLAVTRTELKRTRADLEEARHDPVTGLPTRASWWTRAEQTLRAYPEIAVVVLIDLNGFKALNDTYKHAGGDAVLAEQARRLRMWCVGRGLAGRLGGDEMAAAITRGQGDGELAADLDYLARKLSEPVKFRGQMLDTSAAIGAVRVAELAEPTISQAVHAADLGMYVSKRAAAPWSVTVPPDEPYEIEAAPVARARHHGMKGGAA